jgi:hypothetical protein
MAFTNNELPLTKKARKDIGQNYSKLIQNTRDDRDRRMKDVWALSLSNYEGFAEERDWPWPGASNAFISLTASHSDAWDARLRNAGTAQDPVYLTSAWGPGDIAQGVTSEDYAELWQQASKYLEKEEIDNEDMMEKVSTITTKYGNCIVYLPWEHDEIMSVTYGDDGTPIKEKIDLLNKPVPHVIHPKNFYMPIEEEDIQLSPWCGFDEYWTDDTIRRAIDDGTFNKADGEAVLEWFGAKTKKDLKKTSNAESSYYKLTEDGRHLPPTEWEQELKRVLRAPETAPRNQLQLVRVFARMEHEAAFSHVLIQVPGRYLDAHGCPRDALQRPTGDE